MKRKIVYGLVLTTLLVCTLRLAFNVKLLQASGTIYIRADGSIDPPTPCIQRGGNVYTFTCDIQDSIVVERDNIVIDGAGYTVQGAEVFDSKGINLSNRRNVTIRNMRISTFYYAIYFANSSRNNVFGNEITNNDRGIVLKWYEAASYESSNHNSLSGNNITNNWSGIIIDHGYNNNVTSNIIANNDFTGIWLDWSFNNNISKNIITSREFGIKLIYAKNNIVCRNTIKNNNIGFHTWWHGESHLEYDKNKLYGNNFINNTQQVDIYSDPSGYADFWDNGYPSGGNYYSNYVGADDFWGINQDLKGRDLIGDTPYVIDENNQDNYPLMIPWRECKPPVTEFPDINGDGEVNIKDLFIVATHFGEEFQNP